MYWMIIFSFNYSIGGGFSCGCENNKVGTTQDDYRIQVDVCRVAEDISKRKKKMPTVFKKIFIEYKIQTDRKNKSKIQSKIKYSLNKQCSCCVMLGKSAKVEYKLSIIK